MKILRIIYDWPRPWQGLAPHPYELTISQLKAGHEVEIFSGFWPKSGGAERPGNIKVNTVIREPFPGTIFFTSSVLLFFKYLLWRRSNKVDIIHSHGHFAVWIYLYRYILQKYFPWSKELKTPIVVHFHNIAQSRMDELKENKADIKEISKRISWPMEIFSNKLSLKVASAVIFVSEKNRTDAVTMYKADPKRSFVVETGVNQEIFHSIGQEERDKSRKELGLDMYDKVILNHGMMLERKNIHLLVQSVPYLPKQYKLLLVGPGDSDYLNKIDEIIKNNKLEERVVKVGYTPYPEAPIAYQVSDLFCLPSSYEGLPKAVMQGLAGGVPCLVAGFKLSENISGLEYLDSTDPIHIAERIKQLIENPPYVDVQKVISLYSWDKRSQEVDKIYDFAIKNYLL